MNQVSNEKPILKKWTNNIISTKRSTKKTTTIKKKHTKRKQQIKGKKPSKKKQLANTSPTEYSEKEMKKQVGCVMLNLR
jgi:hypothetical protein